MQCSKCGRDLPDTAFYRRSKGRDPWCKDCRRDYTRDLMAKRRGKERRLRAALEAVQLDPKRLSSVQRFHRRTQWDDLLGDTSKLRGENTQFPGDVAELCVLLWSQPGDLVVDPFAGYGMRGLVALTLGRQYVGYEVAKTTYEWVEKRLAREGGVVYLADGCKMEATPDASAALVLSSPPYHAREAYGTDVAQLAALPYADFLEQIRKCAKHVHRVLKPNGIVVFVVGNWRVDGKLRRFDLDASQALQEAGLDPWDLIILDRGDTFQQFQLLSSLEGRHTRNVHQYALVYRKAG